MGKRILLVEDEAITALDLRTSLVQLGYEVPAVVQRGEDVMRRASELRPDIILMDILLEGTVSGIDAAEEVRRTLRTPVIFLTAHSDPETIARAARAEPFGYLSKPCSMTDLTSTIEIALYKSAADARIRESEERFRVMADSAPVLIWMTGPDGKCTFVNRPWLEFTGRTLAQELGEGWAEALHPDDRRQAGEVYASALAARCRFEMEYRLRRGDGEYRVVLERAEPRFESTGAFAGFVGSSVDITERRAIEDALRESEEKYSQLVQNASEAIFVGQDGVVVFANPASFRMIGLPESQVIGRRTLDLVQPEHRERMLELRRKLESGELRSVRQEYRAVTARGTEM